MDGCVKRAHYNNHIKIRSYMDDDFLVSMYQQYYRNVYNYISFRINNHYDSEDLASLVFENAIRNSRSFDPEIAPVEAWLIGIAKNVVTDYLRKNSKRVFVPLEKITDLVSPVKQPEEVSVLDDEHRCLMLAMTKLGDRDRQILSMKFATELKNTEIAGLLGLSETNVGVIIYRAVTKLKKIIEKGGGFHA